MKRVINKASHATVAETVARLIDDGEARGMKLFIDALTDAAVGRRA